MVTVGAVWPGVCSNYHQFITLDSSVILRARVLGLTPESCFALSVNNFLCQCFQIVWFGHVRKLTQDKLCEAAHCWACCWTVWHTTAHHRICVTTAAPCDKWTCVGVWFLVDNKFTLCSPSITHPVFHSCGRLHLIYFFFLLCVAEIHPTQTTPTPWEPLSVSL